MRRICLYIILLTIFTCCYDDKGNYDYADIGKIEIEAFTGIKVTMGDTVVIEPKLNIEVPDEASYLRYKWTLNGEERPDDPYWNSRNFRCIADKQVTNASIVLEITDTRNGMKYLQRVGCTVVGEFDCSFSYVILSDDNGRSVLSFFRALDVGFGPGYSSMIISDSRFYADLYPARNGGEQLGNGPLGIQEHFHNYENGPGNIWVFQESGTIDLEGEGLTKDIGLDQTFLGGVPVGVAIQGGISMMQVDVLYDQQGRLYSRVKSNNELFHSDYFLPEPLKFQGEVLEDCEPVFGRFMRYDAKYTPIIDRKHHRILAILEGSNTMAGSGKIIACPGEITAEAGYEIPENYIPLDDFSGYEVVSMRYTLLGTNMYNYKPGFVILFKDVSGNLIFQEFALDSYSDFEKGTLLRVSRVKVYEINQLSGVPSVVCVPPNPGSTSYAFFAVDNVLYYFDRDSKNLVPYVTFEAPITALDAESNASINMFMGVGLENGRFYVLDIVSPKNTAEDMRILASSPEEAQIGKIISVKYKIGNGGWMAF